MGEKKIEILPANRETAQQNKMLRAAAYCRVSTGMEEQKSSYESQLRYYEAYIGRKPDWTLAGIYSDRGVSGTQMKNRAGFQKMLTDCGKGRIDVIVTKSISRFSRNTVEFISVVRWLKSLGIAVFFEKECISTLSAKGEMMLTLLSSIAQSEAEAVSSNLKWSIQRRFQNGAFRQFTALGYDYDEAGELAVNETEAETVRLIFKSYLNGMGTSTIAELLNEKGLKGKRGIPFKDGAIRYILKNEIYTGDLLSQKTYTTELPEKQKKKNNGELQMYFIENDHEAIISKEDFDAAQRIMGSRSENLSNGQRYLFSGKIVCGDCGGVFRRRVTSGEVFWLCGNHIKEKSCGQPLGGKVQEREIQQAFVRLCGRLKCNENILEDLCGRLEEADAALRRSGNGKEILREIGRLEKQEQALTRMLGDGYLDPAFYIPEKNRIRVEREKLEKALDLLDSGTGMQEQAEKTMEMIASLKHSGTLSGEFDETLFTEIVEKVIVNNQSEVEFCLNNGLHLKEKIGEV